MKNPIMNNRDLSWLTFNDRVLQEARDKSVPLMQRLRFLGIFSNNQDEFMRVRIANLIRLSEIKNAVLPPEEGGTPISEVLATAYDHMGRSQKIFTATYREILAEMAEFGVRVVDEKNLTEEQIKFCRNYYSAVVSERLVPLGLRRSTKLPFLKDGNIYHAVVMRSKRSKKAQYAIVQIPVSEACPRFVVLPSPEGTKEIILLDDIIRICLDDIFFMFKFDTISAYTFKILRDAYMMVDDDISKSLAEKMEQGLEKRMHGRPIRLVYDRRMPQDVLELLAAKLRLKREAKLNPGGRYHMMRDLMEFPSVLPDLEEYTPEPLRHPDIKPFSSILKVIAKKDIMLHYPYHTFNHVIDFLREAAIDYRVESIFITLYRTANHSKIINALVNAARNGKQVTVLFELRARFDEEQNLENAELLQKEGVKVIHGVGGLKVHSKIILVERKERGVRKGYVYIGTGNFNESTAKIYSDIGILTKNQEIVEDVRSVCEFLALSKPIDNMHLLTAPFNMRETFKKLIEREISFVKKGEPAQIRAKFNSLTDPKMVKLFYKASGAGVDIDLIVRGACCLRPGVPGLSSRIRVISIVDKYLEHARIAIFRNGGDEKVFIMSADFMTRNLDRRVEVGTPIFDRRIKKTLKDIFDIQWNDNVKARDLKNFGKNSYVLDGKEPLRSQTRLYEYYESKGKNGR